MCKSLVHVFLILILLSVITMSIIVADTDTEGSFDEAWAKRLDKI